MVNVFGKEFEHMNMNEILSQLVAADRRGTEIVDTAEENLELTVSNIDREIALFKEQYTKQAEERIGLEKDQAKQITTELTSDISSKYNILKENLETMYHEKHTQWEKELFNRCLGR